MRESTEVNASKEISLAEVLSEIENMRLTKLTPALSGFLVIKMLGAAPAPLSEHAKANVRLPPR